MAFKPNNIQLSNFCHDLSMLIMSGDSFEESLLVMSKKCDDKQMKALIDKLSDEVSEGVSFADAVKNSEAFPKYMDEVMEASAYSGRYEESLGRLSAFYTRKESINNNLRDVLTRPLFFFAILAMVMAFMIGKLLPIFEGVYSRFGGDYGVYIKVGYFVSTFVLVIMCVILVAALVAGALYKKPWFIDFLYRIIQVAPLTKKASLKVAQYQFMSIMDIMLTSGSSQVAALLKASESVSHKQYKLAVEKANKEMDDGEEMAMAFENNRILPELYTNSLYVAMRNGKVPETVSRITDYLADESVSLINGIIATLEPVITIIFTLSIGFSLLSVILPLISVISAVG